MQYFSVFGFTGSRSLPVEEKKQIFKIARFAYRFGVRALVGCAPGSDAAVRTAHPAAEVFRVSSGVWGGGSGAYARRSIAMVIHLAGLDLPVMVGAPGRACPRGLVPSSDSWACFSGRGSGSWASLALAVGFKVPVIVIGLGPGDLPAWPGQWRRLRASDPETLQGLVFKGAWRFCPGDPPQLPLP
ncbi:MAG: hypothetical protein ACOC23_08775 [Thermodesulfobacteriota bacterium]